MPTTEPMEGVTGSPGDDGENIELNRGATHLQWRSVGSPAWIDLIAWVDLKGSDGRQVELQVNATHIQWRYAGDVSWTNLIALTALTGAPGADARRVVVLSATTSAGGDAVFTFSPAFSVAPHIDATITPQSNVNHKCRLTAVSTTGCTVRVESQNQAFLSLLGLDVLSAAVTVVSGATVSITATER